MIRTALSLLLFCFCLYAAEAEQAKDQQEIESKLRTLEEELARYKENLESTEGQKSEIEETLKRNEKGISEFMNKIEDIEHDLNQNRDKISLLRDRQIELNRLKLEQQKYVEQQVRAAYEMGKQEYLKVLLNQEDPNEIARLMTYYNYFIAARVERIKNYNNTLIDLDRVSADLAREMQSLERNRQALDKERSALATTQGQKYQALQALMSHIRSTGTEISKLENDRDHLEKLLSHIQTSLTELPVPSSAQPFKDMRSRMLLPVDGKITETFGKRRNAGKLKWDGLFIEADEGQPVYAVHYGRVIFSDWLRGFGLLLIISHGEGYMSLYGHNQVLYLETGDWVDTGEMIATVGDSGGQSQTGLYFEIRIDGKPSDPQQWCIVREQRAA
ncbi:MAG: peptidoglycan DD-metalloendopeptidase family protein [Pseudomonadales bacterium]|nr:peptidoglycan DD-metalloendopeptidase family protein [Pseudomonadales bacterium]